MATTGGDLIQETSSSSSTGQLTLTGVTDARHRPFPSSFDGKLVSYRIDHASIEAQFELVSGIYTHSTRTLTRPAGNVKHGTLGLGVNTDFSGGGLIVSNVSTWDDLVDAKRAVNHIFAETTVSNPASPYSWDIGTNPALRITGLDHALTINATGGQNGQRVSLTVVQDATGGRRITLGTGFAQALSWVDGPSADHSFTFLRTNGVLTVGQEAFQGGPVWDAAKWFGIKPNSGVDETSQIVAALTYLSTFGPAPSTGRKHWLMFHTGVYLVSNLNDQTGVGIMSAGGAEFQFNSTHGVDTCVLKCELPGVDPRITYGKYFNIKINGTAPSGEIAESGIWCKTSADWSTLAEKVQIYRCGLYGVRILGATNLYLYDMRFDAIGASAILIENEPSRQNLIVVERGTCTWNQPGNLAAWVAQNYIASGAVDGVIAYWGRAVIELKHTGSAGGGGVVHWSDYNGEWHFAGDPAGHGGILDRNASTNVNRPNRLKIDAIRGFTDATHYIVGFAGVDGRQPIVEASVATQDGGGATPIRDFTRSLSFGGPFTTSFDWLAAGTYFSQNGGPMKALAAARPAVNSWLIDKLFVATDTGALSMCTGAAWIALGGGAGGLTSQTFKTTRGATPAARSLASGAGTIVLADPMFEISGTAAAGFDLTIANGTGVGETIEVVVTGDPGDFTVRLMDAQSPTPAVVVGALGLDTVYVLRWSGTTWLRRGTYARRTAALDHQIITTSDQFVDLTIADFMTNLSLIFLTRVGNQFISLPIGVPAKKSLTLIYDEDATGEKVIDGSDLVELKANGILPPDSPQIAGLGVAVTLLSLGGSRMKSIGPVEVATAGIIADIELGIPAAAIQLGVPAANIQLGIPAA